MARKIVVAVQGFVFEGEFSQSERYVHLKDAYCIRKWGTTAGLGELAIKGKQAETVLDYYGVVDIPIGSVVAEMECVGLNR